MKIVIPGGSGQVGQILAEAESSTYCWAWCGMNWF